MTGEEESTQQQRKVCVTGASGFLGSHVVRELLERGYFVHGTVRNPDDPKKVAHLTSLPGAEKRLRLFKADLLQPGAFQEAFEGCEGVFHTASPVILGEGECEEALLPPAVAGTINVLRSCKAQPSIRRVVLTSSTAAVYASFGQKPDEHVYTEEDWSDEERLRARQKWCFLGKIRAERAAWEFIKSENVPFDLVTMQPTWILGPQLQPKLNESTKKIFDYATGVSKDIQRAFKTLVDVRDCALAHVLAFEKPDASGRYLLIGACALESEIVAATKRACPGAKIPMDMSDVVPETIFGPPAPKPLLYCCMKAEALGIRFRGLDEQVEGTIKGLREHGLVSF